VREHRSGRHRRLTAGARKAPIVLSLGLAAGMLAGAPAQAAVQPAALGLQPAASAATAQIAFQAQAALSAQGYSAARAQRVLNEARRHTGKPYRYGAAGPNRFDCSGYTLYVYRKSIGVSLPHKANSQQKKGKAVSKANARPGDLIVFRSGSYGYHVGVYAGGGYMYDSPRPGKTVGKHKIWSNNYVVRRLV